MSIFIELIPGGPCPFSVTCCIHTPSASTSSVHHNPSTNINPASTSFKELVVLVSLKLKECNMRRIVFWGWEAGTVRLLKGY